MTLAFAAVLLVQAAVPAERPVDVVRQATHVVETDSLAHAGSTWRAALARDSTNARARLALATLSRLTYDYDDADRRYADLQALPSVPAAYRAWASLGLAESRFLRVSFDSSASLFERARALARAAGDSTALAEATLGLAFTRWRTSLPVSALATADSGLRIVPARDADVGALGHCIRVAVLAFEGSPKAPDEAAVGIALARRSGNRSHEALCLSMLGQYYLAASDIVRATAAFDSAVVLGERARDHRSSAIAYWGRGNFRLEQYDHDGARRDLSTALAAAETSRTLYIQSWAWIRLAVVSWHFADMVSARRELVRGRAFARDLGDGWGMAYGRYLDGAMAVDAGQIDTAETAFREDLQWGTRSAQPLEQFSALFGLARVAMSRGDWPTARRQFDAASSIARANHLVGYLPQLEYEYGIIAMRSGDVAAAERRFRSVVASRSGVSDLDRYAARSRIAELHVMRGDVASAERELTAASDAIDSLRASLDDHDLRVLVFQARKGYDDVDLGFATVIDALARAGRVDAALGLAERRRARELRDRLVAQSTGSLTRRFAAASVALPEDSTTAILEYVSGEGGQPTTLFAISARGVRAWRRPPVDSLAGDVAAFSGMVEAGAGADVLGKQIADAVFGGVLDSLGPRITRLVIVPDGPLHRIPFDALRLRDGRFVIERYAVSTVPSVAVAMELARARRGRGRDARLLALGDPRFAAEVETSGASAADVYREAFASNGGLPRLRASADEARLVARFGARSELRLRERASESYLKHAPLDSFDVIHLATHALVDERSIARTALAVADGDGDDGFIGAGELSALRLAAQLVVLSACRTARGVAVRGEGVQGLTAPLLAAGARSVLATQWRIRDSEAVRFVDDCYRALAKGQTVTDAARAAKLAAIARGASPATWAAFSVVGDPTVTVPVHAPGPGPVPIAAGIAAIVAAGVLYWLVRRVRRTADRRSVPSTSRAATVQ